MKFLYFGYQCPHNAYLLARIKTVAWQEHAALHLFDITNDEEAARQHRVFSPTMVIVNDRYRWHGPFSKELIVSMLEDEPVEPRTFTVDQSDEEVRGELVPIDAKSVLKTCVSCMSSEDPNFCRGKAEWVGERLRETGMPDIGLLHFVDGRCAGGAEFLPSTSVPYPIPDKRKDNAFLTCSYVSDEKKDYRGYPLDALARRLRDRGFRTLSTVASTDVVFPNGPVKWFERRGFADKGLLVREELHRAELHYLQLEL